MGVQIVSYLLALCVLCSCLSSEARPASQRRRPSRVARSETLLSQQRSAGQSTNHLEESEAPWSCSLATRPNQYVGISPLKTSVLVDETWCQDHPHHYPLNGTEVPPTKRNSSIRHSKFTTCHGTDRCLPIASAHEELNLYTGILTRQKAHRCKCFSTTEPCRPVKHIEVFFANTPYRASIDTKRCIGSCARIGRFATQSCKAVKNHTVTIAGPNGAHCVNVIDECACERGCYRESRHVAHIEHRVDTGTGEKTLGNKTIDVGLCTGSCEQQVVEDCMEKSNVNESTPGEGLQRIICENRAKGKKYECVPKVVIAEVFNTTKGVEVTVPIIKSCTCIQKLLPDQMMDPLHGG